MVVPDLAVIESRSELRSWSVDNISENARKLLGKGHNKDGGGLTMHSANADELTGQPREKNRDLIHDSVMVRTPVSSGARRFSEGTCYVNVEIFWAADRFRDQERCIS